MRRTMVGVLLAIGLLSVGAYAQDAFFAFRAAGFIDIQITQPCAAGLKGSASMTVYDTNAWIVYTCNDDRVILRRYLNPNDNAHVVPLPVYVVPTPDPENAPAAPKPIDSICPGNFVHTVDGQGCVPPNHPLAPKR